MNIQQAKDQIRNTVIAYLTMDNQKPMIPIERQRPIFLTGAPGIGKTAIVRQVAEEMNIGFVSYSITHHTRQSALGLPFIVDQEFEGRTFRISEYTMSEIIASCYRQMAKTGIRKGILFLDEVNCVSETLAPAMLQFLQYKVFGQHQVPEGWIVVTAGNPTEFNRQAREFDVVTMDRLKVIDVEPDFETWRNWAESVHIHPSVLSYLTVRPHDLFHMESTLDGVTYTTPRGWTDLSDMIFLYELNGIRVDALLIRQYLRDERIARQFDVFYEMYRKYEEKYRAKDILAGNYSETLLQQARDAAVDERISLTGLLLDALFDILGEVNREHDFLVRLKTALRHSEESSVSDDDVVEWIREHTKGEMERRAAYEANVAIHRGRLQKAEESLEGLFRFIEMAFGDGTEMELVMTSLVARTESVEFIRRYGSDGYQRNSKKLHFYERRLQFLQEIERLDL